METNTKIKRNDILNNTLKVQNKIKLNLYKGVLGGNIIEEKPPEPECLLNSLDFTCANNSEYIPLL